jgi:hypothetical protein
MVLPTGERIAGLEQHMIDIDDKLKTMSQDINDIKKILEKEPSLREKVDQLEKKAGLWQWLSPTISAAFSSLVTFLIVYYFQNIR